MKTVIIGGVAGGATAATRLRRLDEQMEIVVLERGEYISYANCGLPFYVGDVIKERNSLLVTKPETMRERYHVDVRIRSTVTRIDPVRKTVTVSSEGQEYEESYDNLLLATGSSPIRPKIPGIDLDGIYTVWTVPDVDHIRAVVDAGKAESAVVIGGGFIGIEMAENLRARGLQVDLAEAMNQVMAQFDFEMAQLLHENIEANGVGLHLGDGVSSFEKEKNGKLSVKLSSGKVLTADIAILAIGVRTNSQLAKDAGLAMNEYGSVIVNEEMQTSDPHIWAVGDVVQSKNFITGGISTIRLAGPANKQARIAANNIAAVSNPEAGYPKDTYSGVLGTSVVQVFDLTAAATGVSEKELQAAGKKKGIDYESILIVQKSHAGYYPQATQMFMKLLFDHTGKIYGAQIIGQDGADKRIDTISAIIGRGGTVRDLKTLEAAYAPAYSSAKDPVNMLGFTAENVLSGLIHFTSWNELEGKAILDIGEDVERSVWSMPGSVHIPLGQLRSRLNELDRSRHWVVYCVVGVRSYNAARILMQSGFEHVEVLAGGSTFYKSAIYKPTGKSLPPTIQSAPSTIPEPSSRVIRILDCTGLQCPGPIMKVNEAMKDLREGETIRVTATDMGFARDVESWCRHTGNTYVSAERKGKENIVTLRKGIGTAPAASENMAAAGPAEVQKAASAVQGPDGLSMIVFDGDLDKAIASFIIANGALAMGKPVTMFFTFWGLNILRRNSKIPVRKNATEKMFSSMMPRGTEQLGLSRMNMLGMGPEMIRKVMKDKNVDSLESLMQKAIEGGAKIYACTMSMDIMGIKKEELIDGVECVGVATYLAATDSSNVNLFI